jgi:hypothetical protein
MKMALVPQPIAGCQQLPEPTATSNTASSLRAPAIARQSYFSFRKGVIGRAEGAY